MILISSIEYASSNSYDLFYNVLFTHLQEILYDICVLQDWLRLCSYIVQLSLGCFKLVGPFRSDSSLVS